WAGGFTAFDELRKLNTNAEGKDWNYEDPADLEELKKECEVMISATLSVYEADEPLGKDSHSYKKLVSRLGIKYKLNAEGKIEITDMTNWVEGLKDYQKYAILMRDAKSGNKESAEELKKVLAGFNEKLAEKELKEKAQETQEQEQRQQEAQQRQAELQPLLDEFYYENPLNLDVPDQIATIRELEAETDVEVTGDYVKVKKYLLSDLTTGKVWAGFKRGKDDVVVIKENPVDSFEELARINMLPKEFKDPETYLADAGFSHENILLPKERVHNGKTVLRAYEAGSKDLEHFLLEKGSMEPKVAISIMVRVCDGVAALHRAGVVHYDIAPLNIILSKDKVRLTDLEMGSIDAGGDGVFKKGAMLGNRFIMPPELFTEQPIFDRTVDIYSSASTLYYLIAKKWPHNIDSQTKDLAQKERMEKYRLEH
ncbi:MAG: protein kinase, partial [Patescibacteria group bacterium]